MAETQQQATSVNGVSPANIVALWPQVAPILERVVSVETGYGLDHVLTELQLQKWQLWIIGEFRGVVVTAIQPRPAERVLWVQYMAGEGMADWLDDWAVVQDEYARLNECTAIEFQSSRAAWEKIGKRYPEYKTTYAIYRRTL
jgi:hypothetical protein